MNIESYKLLFYQLFVALGVVCYRKATNLKRAVVQKQHQDTDPDRSDSTVYFQDMILCSEDSETDDGMLHYRLCYFLIWSQFE